MVVVRRERGDRVTIPRSDIVSGKTVPPRPSPLRRLGAEEADRRANPGWQPVEEEALGEWLMRASSGFSNRGNSVLALGDPGVPLDEVVPRVVEWYDARGLTPRAHVLPDSPTAAAFEAAGWSRYETTVLMLASLARALRQTPPATWSVQRRSVVDAGWLATDERAARYGEAARQVLEGRTGRGHLRHRARRRGHRDRPRPRCLPRRLAGRLLALDRPRTCAGRAWARRCCGHCWTWGAERGATTAYLQVVESNEAALRLYESRGFELHHTYAYYVAPG